MNIIATESSGNPSSSSAGTGRPAGKFVDPERTADGQPRAIVRLQRLETLWLNTGTLCNLTCEHCYIESSPSNDKLSYLTRAEAAAYIEQIRSHQLPVREIGVTGGEPFMNPDILGILEDALMAGHRVLVLTNAMRPMMKCAVELERLAQRYREQLAVRVSIDHFDPELHEEERGPRSWAPMIAGLKWLATLDCTLQVAGRTRWGDDEQALRAGFAGLFDQLGIALHASDPADLTLFPEMDESADVPEISTACWAQLGVEPSSMMCATSRMVVKRRGAARPEVVSCTLLPYETAFSMGHELADSLGAVALNHPHCARFCVLGGGSCSG